MVGDACLKLRHQLDISYPVNNGIVQNWDDMGHVWDHAFFNELKVNLYFFYLSHNILMSPSNYSSVLCSNFDEINLIIPLFLKVDPTACKILLTDPPLNPSKNREKMVSFYLLKRQI